MRLTTLSRLAYRCQGGSLETSAGRLDPIAAKAELNGLYALGQDCIARGDNDGAEFCACMIDCLGDAARGVLLWGAAA